MVRPRQVSSEDILIAARALFVEHGPSLSTQRIAEAVGLSQAALFKRFHTKQELMLAALKPPEVPPFLAMLEQGPDDRDFRVQLHEVCLSISQFLMGMVPAMMCLKAAGVEVELELKKYDLPPPVRAHRAIAEYLRRAQLQGLIRADAEVDPLGVALLGTLHVRAFVNHLQRDLAVPQDLNSYVATVVDLFWRALAPGEPK